MTDITNTGIKGRKEVISSDFNELRKEASILQKKGVPFMMSSVVIWTLVTVVRLISQDIMTKNRYTFFCTGLLIPCTLFFALITHAKLFKARNNPFNKLGFLCTMNQMLYLLIVMWAFSQKPDAMLMIFAMVFGAHLLPYSWVYDSKTYLVTSIVTTLGSMILSIFAPEMYVSIFMAVCQAVMCVFLLIECRGLERSEKTVTAL